VVPISDGSRKEINDRRGTEKNEKKKVILGEVPNRIIWDKIRLA
jgi:hypothetical protein